MGRYGDLDYPKLARRGFFVGIALLAVGVLGEFVGPLVVGSLPGQLHTLFVDLEALGILVGLFAPLTFAIALPLTE